MAQSVWRLSYGLDGLRIWFQSLPRVRDITLLRLFQTDSEAHPARYSVSPRDAGDKAALA
jgi:hypothetical protein